MNPIKKGLLLFKEIGFQQLLEYGLFTFKKRIGLLLTQTPPSGFPTCNEYEPKLVAFPSYIPDLLKISELDKEKIISEANFIVEGYYRPFSGELAKLDLSLNMNHLVHWTAYGDRFDGLDIKWIWEPARFSWAFDLARAYLLTTDEKYCKTFWDRLIEFEYNNPVNIGPNWVSAQECALRVITWMMIFPVFEKSKHTNTENRNKLIKLIWHSASRIPCTLGYARSQNNNHLLSEALGLYLAGSLFAAQSWTAQKWQRLGAHEFERGLRKQIEKDGTYKQHSANYHRLMLQLALIYHCYTQISRFELSTTSRELLASSTRWLIAQLDPVSGSLPNLGHNDGTLLLPFGSSSYSDYRPTAQASSLAFLKAPCLPSGPWDECCAWLNIDQISANQYHTTASPAVHKIQRGDAWATLRAVKFQGRPAHADQLHLELWWDGFNLAQDAGTFCYNDEDWQNLLTTTLVHNSVSIDNADQMQRVGKFLWLDQAQAEWREDEKQTKLSASHNGYRKLGIQHQRSAFFTDEKTFQVEDLLTFTKHNHLHQISIHWLLPDWDWTLKNDTFTITRNTHQVEIQTSAFFPDIDLNLIPNEISVIRGGETLLGVTKNPIKGWYSPTYGVKNLAISLTICYEVYSSLKINTIWNLIDLESRKAVK